jgi:ubiquinone biosynthesis protein
LIAESLRLIAVARRLSAHRAIAPEAEAALPAPARLGLRLAAWGTEEAHDPMGASPGERLAAALDELGPTYVKLGQSLAARPDVVGAEVANALSGLQDRLPPFPWEAARKVLEAELGQPIDALYESFGPVPVAAASIAQVHFATTREGEPVAVKILRPGIEAAFDRDLRALGWGARLAERMVPAIRRLRPIEVVATLAESTRIETDLRLEAAAASELAQALGPELGFAVPKVHWPLTARRVLTVERIDGIPIGDVASLEAAGHDLKALSARLIQAFLTQALVLGFFHADMHQGNLFVRADGTIVAVDFGIMGRLDRPMRRFLAETLLGFITADYRRVAQVHADAGILPPSKSVELFAQACRSIGEPILGRRSADISMARLLAQLFQVTETFDMETQPQLLLLQKTMVVVEGVARGLDPEASMWEIARPVVERWMVDNLGPEARLWEAADNAASLARRLPLLIERAERAANQITERGIRLHPDSARDIARAQDQGRSPWIWATFAFAALAIAALAFG